MRRLAVLPLTLLTFSFLFLSCDTPPEAMVAPDDTSAAKGGKPGKPGEEEPQELSLVEYYVIPSPDGTGSNMIHLVVDGVVDGTNARAGFNVVHDYFFNGVRDWGAHYEWYWPTRYGSRTYEVEGNRSHIDIEWSGVWADLVGCTETECSYGDVPHVDYPATDVGGADPFAFAPLIGVDGSIIERWRPEGVVLDAVEGGAKATLTTDDYHDSGTVVTSYALNKGEDPTVTIGLLSMVGYDASCSTRTIREGRGKDKTTRTETVLSATADVQFHTSDGSIEGYWAELHVRPVSGGFVPLSNTTLNGSAEGIGITEPRTVNVRTGFDGELGTVDVELVMDYLHATDAGAAYDPGYNTDDGFTTIGGPSTTLDDGNWPEAVLDLGTVTCK